MASPENEPKDKGRDYEKKSRRIQVWSDFLRSISRVLWLVVILVVLVVLGKIFLFKSPDRARDRSKPVKKPVVMKVEWGRINQKVEKIMNQARLETEKLASEKLDQWIDKHMERVDRDFLDWYFSYWTQQKIGLKSLLYQVLNWVDSDNPPPAERITLEVQEEFANRVLRPQIAQMEVERILNQVISHFSEVLNREFKKIPGEYQIRQADWERYLDDIAVMVKNVEANRQTALTLKAIAGVTAGGMVMMFRSIKTIITRVGGKISARMAAKSASGMATKTGSIVASRMGGRFLGTIIAVGIIIWDVWDHYQTRKKALPMLRENIRDYFSEVKESILHDPEYGIMTIIYSMELSVSEEFKKQGE